MVGFIDDGYTRDDGYITAAPAAKSGERLWDSLDFTYRVATRTEIVRHDSEVRMTLKDEDNDPECAVKAELLACEFVAKRISAWNVKNSKGSSVPITTDNCARLQSHLFSKLYRIIRGTELSDPRPLATEVPVSDTEMLGNLERVSG